MSDSIFVSKLPLTLIDYPKHIASMFFVKDCNMKCPYCHNLRYLKNNKFIQHEEIIEFLNKRKKMLSGIILSGGEILLQKYILYLSEFIPIAKDIGYDIKIDTNGTNPLQLNYLLNKNLINYVAMDIKNISCFIPSRDKNSIKYFNKSNIQWQIKSFKLLVKYNADYELRTTMVKEFINLNDIVTIAKLLWEMNGKEKIKKWFLQKPLLSKKIVLNDKIIMNSFTNSELIIIKNQLKKFVNYVDIR